MPPPGPPGPASRRLPMVRLITLIPRKSTSTAALLALLVGLSGVLASAQLLIFPMAHIATGRNLWLRVVAAMWLLLMLLSGRSFSGASAAAPVEQVDLPTPSNERQLQDITATYREMQSRFDEKLEMLLAARQKVNEEINSLASEAAAAPVSVPSVDDLYDAMDGASTKVADLVRRTKEVNRRVREYNLKSLKDGHSTVAPLLQRLNNTLNEETRRRASYRSEIEALKSTADDDEDEILEEETSELQEERQAGDESSSYISIVDLNGLLSEESLIQPSEVKLVTSLMILANEQMSKTVADIQSMWDKRVSDLPLQFEAELMTLQESAVRKEASGEDGSCLAIPRAVELVQKALVEHYNDGTGAKDYAAYENGGTIVHELTSSPYVPPPRNGDEGIAAQKQRMFDEQAEALYWQQRSLVGDDPGLSSVDVWDIYTSFKFEALRQYLPDDWERLMDSTFGSWDESTPRGMMDALTPDYVHHALGLANDFNFGSAYGRTASAEAPITIGQSKSGDATGWSAKPMGSCYPLSMQADDDPVLAMLSREMYVGSNDVYDSEDTETSKLITGPKLTVRLPHAIHIDAVTLEHRSFPAPPNLLQQGLLGGESAPRWVRVVGYPPCDGDTVDDITPGEEDEESCSSLGFDVDRPIDLGTIEYERITVTGREDDYGAVNEDDEATKNSYQRDIKRRRSIQTFVVKGGNKQTLFHEEDGSENESETLEGDKISFQMEGPANDDLPPGSCAPPQDDEVEPSCGGDKPGGDSPRHIVEAVSFIIEENWGGEYTCLYRVRVHGEPL